MSSRIRIYASHPQFGECVGPAVKYNILSHVFSRDKIAFTGKNSSLQVKHLGELNGWTVKLFRVPRGVKLAKTEWGRFLAGKGLFPYKERIGKRNQNVRPDNLEPQRGELAQGNPFLAVQNQPVGLYQFGNQFQNAAANVAFQPQNLVANQVNGMQAFINPPPLNANPHRLQPGQMVPINAPGMV